MLLIGVAPTKFSRALGHPKGARPDYEKVDLELALEREYQTDAHLVAYVDMSTPDDHQHRLSKAGLDAHPNPDAVQLTCVFVDVDNPNHGRWTDESRAAAIESYSRLPFPMGVYHTEHGARFVLVLAHPIPVRRAEAVIYEVLRRIEAAGFAVDWHAKDWTRHFRLPHVRRDGRFRRSAYVDLSRLEPVEVFVPLHAVDEPAPVRRRKPAPPPIAWTSEIGERWRPLSTRIADAIRATVTADYHAMYLAIGGALASRGVPVEVVPELVRDIARGAGSSKPEHHAKGARDTVAKYAAGLSVSGLYKLGRDYPAVADAIVDAVDDVVPRPPPVVPAETLAETSTRLYSTILSAGDGLSVVKAECGLGKTYAAQRVAVTRAAKRHLTVVSSTRAPAQSRTAISVDKNELSAQVAADIAASGTPVRRVFGPLSVPGACIHADRAAPLVNGGQSLAWEFCEGRRRARCEAYEACTVRLGYIDLGDSSSTPRVTVGPHALLSTLDAAATSSGLLVIDEPPPLLVSATVTQYDVELALKHVYEFDVGFARDIAPVLLAVQGWRDPRTSFAELTAGLDPVDATKRPPLRASAAHRARCSLQSAVELGAASRTLLTLSRATSPSVVAVALDEDTWNVVVTSTRDDLVEALKRDGSVVVTDANAELHLDAFRKVVGYDPPLSTFTAADGAPVERTHVRASSSSRRAWFAHGRLVLDTGALSAVREVVSWALERRVMSLGIVTMRVLELAVLAGLGRDVAEEWTKAGQLHFRENAAAMREALAPLAGVSVSTAHYGATRGLNRLAGVDALATLGDPWPNVGHVQTEATYLGVDADERLEAVARAELEQAHGRLRVVHRTRPGYALHVGRVVPGGAAWSSEAVVRRAPREGRPSGVGVMTQAEVRAVIEALGGARAAARVVGCSPSTMVRYSNGEREVPSAVVSALRAATNDQLLTSFSSDCEGDPETLNKISPGIGVSGSPGSAPYPLEWDEVAE